MENGKRILIVDDESVIRDCLTLFLQSQGYHAVSASDGRVAIQELARMSVNGGYPSLVITDNTMPELDGIGLIRHIRGLPGGFAIPIVLMSGYDVDIAVYDLAISAFLKKPFKSREVTALLEKFLK